MKKNTYNIIQFFPAGKKNNTSVFVFISYRLSLSLLSSRDTWYRFGDVTSRIRFPLSVHDHVLR